ncbi:Hpt domain-containing protein [Aliikangiella sp. IMCC44653]
MSDNYDQLALSWVRKEINNTLEQARQGLESFADDIQDQTQIQFCINCLHQVQGTLQMLEFSGAAKLAQEMELLAEKMATDSKFAVESSFEVLMRALLQMPGYLERVEDGQKDIPIVLLPLINELRAAAEESPLDERELFSADTYSVVPPKASEAVSDEDKTSAFQDNAKKLRAHFQKGLTGLIRGDKPKESLSRIHKVLLRLEALTEGHSVSRLWWVADGFIFSITEGGLFKKKEIHMLLAQVDKQIKRLSDLGTDALDDVIPDKLLSDILYYVARSNSKNARVEALKKEFNLQASLADSEEIKQQQKKLTKPDSTAITSVVGAINEELATVKDQLDLFVRSQAKDISELQSLVESLNRISDTLTLLELAIPRDVVRQQIMSINKLIENNKMPDDSMVMDIAGALLFVEANLKNVNLESSKADVSDAEAEKTGADHAKESQVDDATHALIKAARKSMQAAKDHMINYIASDFDKESLAQVPGLLQEVLGGVRIVSFDDAADILEIALAFVNRKILNQQTPPNESHLDALADVITSVEYYLDASEEGTTRGVASILKGAQQSVATLQASLDTQDDIEPVEAEPELQVDTEQQSSNAAASEQSSAKAEPVSSAEIIPLVTASADKQVDETLIDEEVLEIFLEEAEEEIQVIDDMLPRWSNNVNDEDALTTLRRSFHTLKGSGRLVGAKVIGDVSWAVENTLNKVIEESIPAESPVIALLSEARSILPTLVEAFANQTSVDIDYQEFIAKANHIAEGKAIASFDYTPQGSVTAEPEIEEEQESAVTEEAVEAIDPILLEIFSTEAEGHLNSIQQYLKDAPSEGTVAISDELIRSLHTLKGSANMAGVTPISVITGPWEKAARIAKGSNQRFEQATISLLAETHEFLEVCINNLKAGEFNETEYQSLLSRVEQLKVAPSGSDSNVKHRDQQFVSIFLTEGLDILQEVTRLNDELKSDLNNPAIKESIRAELHTFHRGAEMVSIDEMGLLAFTTEQLAAYAVESDNLDAAFCELLNESVDCLMGMLNRIASEEDIESPQALVDKLSQWMEGSDDEAIPQDMDEELVELFVEEGEELIESARELLARWKDNLHSKEIISELRRIYHTLKGSSRMAGAMTIGDLGYAVEDVFNTVVDFGREVTEKDYPIVESATNKLEAMIATLKRLKWPKAADSEIQKVRNHLNPELAVTAPEEAAPSETVTSDTADSEVLEPITEDTTDEIESELEIPTLKDTEEPADEFSFELPEEPADDIQAEQEFTVEAEEEIPTVIDTVSEEEVSLETGDSEAESALDEEIEFGEISLEVPAVDYSEAEVSEELIETESAEQDLDASEDSLEQDETSELTDEASAFEFSELEQAEEFVVETTDEISDESTHQAAADETTEIESLETESVEIEATDDSPEFEQAETEQSELVSEVTDTEEPSAEESSHQELAEAENMEALIQLTHKRSQEATEKVKESNTETRTADTIQPAAPIVMSGNVHKIELDEDGEEVLEIYLEEAEELLEALDEGLHDWADGLENKETIDLLQRTLHTFKGGARLSDLVVLGDLTHEMETYFEKVTAGQLTPTSADVDFMLQGYDVIEKLVKEVETERQMTVPEAYMQALHALIKGEAPAPIIESTPQPEEAKEDKAAEEPASAEVVSFAKKKQQQEEVKQKSAASTEVVRVSADQLENLVNLAGETSIFRSRLEQQMSVLRYNLEEMNSTVERLREQLRNLDIETDAQISYRKEVSGVTEYEDFDPLEMDRYTRQQELTRGLSESAVDLVSLKETLDLLTADSETLLLQQGRVNTEMQESLMRTRMIPFESLVPRLRRMVRQISTELGKTIELTISADGEMDRTVLERMIAPLEHMLRNAMDHGIEPPSERKANQKSETGTVNISMYREGSEVFVKIKDDGRGLNLQAIRKKAIEKGLITESSELTDHELQQLILEAGFSTAEQITQISGRGVGMDVVHSEIKQLGGVIEIDSKQGQGTTFTVKLPFTMSVNHALMVKLGEEVYAIPLSNIEGIVRVSPFELEEYYANPDSAFEYAGIDYSMYHLGQMLDHKASANLQGITQPLPVLLLHGADHPTALQVDDLLGSREIVVKTIGSQLSTVSGLSGATILGDGRVVLILDMPSLIRRIDVNAAELGGPEVEVVEEKVPTIMVVDDSITVRKVTKRLLERHDFEVITAKDGVDALSILGEHKPDVMLLDIEMPRMDGFELATIIRHDEGLKDLPIIMITSRTGEKHRERAEQIGVNDYMGKPYNEVDLLDTISALLPNKS